MKKFKGTSCCQSVNEANKKFIKIWIRSIVTDMLFIFFPSLFYNHQFTRKVGIRKSGRGILLSQQQDTIQIAYLEQFS